MTTLLVDTNEFATAPYIVKQLQEVFTILPVKLRCGDINVCLPNGNLLIIERKAPSDLLASIGDGRLFDQAERMVTLSPWSFIIINGAITYNNSDMAVIDGEASNWRGASVRNALLAVQLAGCVVTSTDGVGLICTIEEIISLCSKTDHSPSVRKQRALTFPPIDTRIEILAQFPGVGYKRAEAILRYVAACPVNPDDEFGSIASAIEWATLLPLINENSHPEGWGKITIANFRTILGLAADEYLNVRKDLPPDVPN